MEVLALLLGLGAFLTTVIIVVLVAAAISFLVYIVKAIAFFMIGKKAGYSLSWISFFPIVQYLVPTVLPHREYKLAFFKPKKRITVFWVMLVLQIVSGFVYGIYSAVNRFTYELGLGTDLTGLPSGIQLIFNIILIVGAVIAFLIWALGLLLMLVWNIMKIRMDYDLFMTYQMYNSALVLSIVSFFIPVVSLVVYLILIGKEPEYGYGNYEQETEIVTEEVYNEY